MRIRLLHKIEFHAITLLAVSVSCRSSSDCSAVCLFSLYLSVKTHTGLLNDGPVRFTREDI